MSNAIRRDLPQALNTLVEVSFTIAFLVLVYLSTLLFSGLIHFESNFCGSQNTDSKYRDLISYPDLTLFDAVEAGSGFQINPDLKGATTQFAHLEKLNLNCQVRRL